MSTLTLPPALAPGIDRLSPAVGVPLPELVSALSCALDLVEGQPPGHAVRTCVLGLHLAERLQLDAATRRHLYFALLLKDAGCSSNAARLCQILGSDEIRAKRNVKTTDWTRVGWESLRYAWAHVRTGRPLRERLAGMAHIALHRKAQQREVVQIRCHRGGAIARKMGFAEPVCQAIYHLDEHWNGAGYPDGLRGQQIPLLARILSLCQTLEVFAREHGLGAALNVARQRSGRWFDPELVRAAVDVLHQPGLAEDLAGENARRYVLAHEPQQDPLPLGEERLDAICEAFAEVVDAKSPFTYRHSTGVAQAALSMAATLELAPEQVSLVRRAALLHDIGKLGVPSTILEKPGKLTDEERTVVLAHPRHSYEILCRVKAFAELALVAGAHHERLDGRGYWQGWGADQLGLPARLLAVADVYDALSAERPYRPALPAQEVFAIMERDVPRALDPECFAALRASQLEPGTWTNSLLMLTNPC